jgi:hypothetical protein
VRTSNQASTSNSFVHFLVFKFFDVDTWFSAWNFVNINLFNSDRFLASQFVSVVSDCLFKHEYSQNADRIGELFVVQRNNDIYYFFTGWPLIYSFMIISQTVGLLGRVISSSQGLYLNTEQHKHRINTFFSFGATAHIWALAYLHETFRFTSIY